MLLLQFSSIRTPFILSLYGDPFIPGRYTKCYQEIPLSLVFQEFPRHKHIPHLYLLVPEKHILSIYCTLLTHCSTCKIYFDHPKGDTFRHFNYCNFCNIPFNIFIQFNRYICTTMINIRRRAKRHLLKKLSKIIHNLFKRVYNLYVHCST